MSFDWNFNAYDYLPFNDYSIFQVQQDGVGTITNVTLADVAAVGYWNATGWNTYNYTFLTGGSGTISFGVYNALDNSYNSQLYLDNIGGGAPVPEPATMLLFGTGLAGLVGLRRRQSKK